MGPAVLITIGILFLLDQVTHVHWMGFGRTWPALLIIIGLVMFMQHNTPTTGHIPREYMGMPPAPPVYPQQQQQQWRPPAVTPPPAPPAGPAANTGTTDQGEVHNG
jgi:hypothetical protein